MKLILKDQQIRLFSIQHLETLERSRKLSPGSMRRVVALSAKDYGIHSRSKQLCLENVPLIPSKKTSERGIGWLGRPSDRSLNAMLPLHLLLCCRWVSSVRTQHLSTRPMKTFFHGKNKKHSWECNAVSIPRVESSNWTKKVNPEIWWKVHRNCWWGLHIEVER